KPYIPHAGEPRMAVEGKEGFTELINAYVPWEYIMMMPFAVMPRTFSWILYFALMMAGLWVVFRVGKSFGMRFADGGHEIGVAVGAAPILLAGLPIYQNFHAGNLALPVLLSSALMAACLNRGKDALAGVCWAFAMLKPNLGLAFAIPLLMRKKFLTCIVAAGTCLALTAISSLLCSTSPFALVLQGPAASAFAFVGCGTFPYFLCGMLPGSLDVMAGIAVGAVVCLVMTRVLVRAGFRDWIVLAMPAAVVGAAWSYSQCYCFTMNWFFFAVLAAALARRPRSKFLWCIAVASALLMTRIYNFAHTLAGLALGSGFDAASELHYHVDSLVTTAGLAVAAAFCAWLSRNTDGMRADD
ncbi:MAG: DUF2029 domain-containing protein, partial [Kiritimatiellae bacterium]|nr:DUF2029 domain-containing protein [Kiritimatiellia bacterium]